MIIVMIIAVRCWLEVLSVIVQCRALKLLSAHPLHEAIKLVRLQHNSVDVRGASARIINMYI